MKRILSLVLALSMVLSMFSFSFAASSLKDISGTNYEAAVEALMELGVVDGYPDGTYLPNNVVTRAELAKLLVTAYGLSQAAEVASGVTPFSDVAGNWAAGYINVSSDYKFVNGYPDGTFMPNETVTYAEAITMCLRVLGYANEVDAKGTWPTNYIAKAQDLKLMKDVDYKSYNDGATRGNVANLIWKMLRTPMWEVTSESEGDGLVSEKNREMINVKFSDYTYVDDAKFTSFAINKDSKKDVARVDVTLSSDELGKKTWEYTGNDFYQFVPGTEVEVLVNKEEGTLLTLVPTGDDTIVSGTKEELDDDYNALDKVDYAYAYGMVESKEITNNVTLDGKSTVIDGITVKDKKITLKENGKSNSYENKVTDYWLILKDGERIALKDVKEGDIMTEVTVSYNGKKQDTFYVVGGTSAEGKLKDYFSESFKNSSTNHYVLKTTDNKYLVDANLNYVEDPEKDTITVATFKWNSKMEKEEVTLKLDPIFGRVVRVEFDGKIDGGSNGSDIEFYGIADSVRWDADAKRYTITLVNADGEKEYKFTKSAGTEKASPYEKNDITGYFAEVELNDDGDIKDFDLIAMADENGTAKNVKVNSKSYAYGDDKNDKYTIKFVASAKYDKDEEAIMNGTSPVNEVDDSVVVVTLNYDDKEEEYSVEFAKGLDGIAKLKDEPVIVVWDEADSYKMAKYVVLFDKTTDNSDNLAGKVTTVGNSYVTVEADGSEEDYTYKDGKLNTGDVVVFTTKEKDEDITLKVVSSLTVKDSKLQYITEADGRRALLDGESINLDRKATADKYEDYMVVFVEMDDKDVDSVSTGKYDDVSFADFDRVYFDDDEDIMYIITGWEERTTTPTPTPAPTTTTDSGEVEYKLSVWTRDAETNESGDAIEYTQSGDATTVKGTSGDAVEYSTTLEGYKFDKVDPADPKVAKDLEVKTYFTKSGDAK